MLLVGSSTQVGTSNSVSIYINDNLLASNLIQENSSGTGIALTENNLLVGNSIQASASSSVTLYIGGKITPENCIQENSSGTGIALTENNLLINVSIQENNSTAVAVSITGSLLVSSSIQANYSSGVYIVQNVPSVGAFIHDRELALAATDPRVIATSTIIESSELAVVVMDAAGVIGGFPITLTATTFTGVSKFPQQLGNNWDWYYISNADNIRNSFTPISLLGIKVITEALFNAHRGVGTKVTYIAKWRESSEGYLTSEGSYSITLNKILNVVTNYLMPVTDELSAGPSNLGPIKVPDGFGIEVFWLKMLLDNKYRYIPYIKYGAGYVFEIDTNLSTTGPRIGPLRVVKMGGSASDCTIDWGDGNIVEYIGIKEPPIHIYSSHGIYTISIFCPTNSVNYISFLTASGTSLDAEVGNRKIVTKIISFGAVGAPDFLKEIYYNFINLVEVPAYLPGNFNTLESTFTRCTNFNSANISRWNISNIENLSWTFAWCTNFNRPLSSWNTSKVTNMSRMFRSASSFNMPIGTWNTSNVLNMSSMFYFAWAFNQPIGTWNTSNVTDMYIMFANNFNQPIGAWDTSKVTNMAYMFSNNIVFNQDIGNWNTNMVTNMAGMFMGAKNFNKDLSSWCVSMHAVTPPSFDFAATSWVLSRPIWGTCP